VDLEAHGAGGQVLFELHDVPFDVERGQVLLACQLHYRSMPEVHQMRATLRATSGAARRELGQYILNHQFESA
jgi:hypothetical protein